MTEEMRLAPLLRKWPLSLRVDGSSTKFRAMVPMSSPWSSKATNGTSFERAGQKSFIVLLLPQQEDEEGEDIEVGKRTKYKGEEERQEQEHEHESLLSFTCRCSFLSLVFLTASGSVVDSTINVKGSKKVVRIWAWQELILGHGPAWLGNFRNKLYFIV